MGDVKLIVRIESAPYKNSRDYEQRDRLAEFEVPVSPAVAWSLFRHAVDVISAPEVVITEGLR